jgi:hypothetical protein
VLGTSAALCWGVGDVAIALLARRAPFVTVAVVVQGASVVMLVALAVALGDLPQLSVGQWVMATALGPIGATAYLAFYKALQLGPIASARAARVWVAAPAGAPVGVSGGRRRGRAGRYDAARPLGLAVVPRHSPGFGGINALRRDPESSDFHQLGMGAEELALVEARADLAGRTSGDRGQCRLTPRPLA